MAAPILGISLGSASLSVAEVRGVNGKSSFVRGAEMAYGAESLENPAALGRKLSQFLKQNNFTAGKAIIGLPAQWLMLKEKSLPAASPEVLASMLQIQAEREFSIEPSELAIDYIAGKTGPEGLALMLIATARSRIEQAKAIAENAGLKLQAITGTSLALIAETARESTLYFGVNGVELVTFGADGLPRVRYISPASTIRNRGPQNGMQLTGELRRAFGQIQQQSTSELTVWDDAGIDPKMVQDVAADLGVKVKPGRNDAAAAHASGSAAVALAQSNVSSVVDFLHSRLAVKPAAKFTAKARWGAIAAGIAVIAGALMFWDWRSSATLVAELRQQHDGMKESVDSAKAFINRVNTTRTWYERRPNYLECLRTITMCFPEEGRVWASSVSLREDMHGILMGRAGDEKNILDVYDAMRLNSALSEVKMLPMRGTGGRNAEVSFGISFYFVGSGKIEKVADKGAPKK